MEFASFTFLFMFIPIICIGYYLLKFSRGLQNTWLFLASFLFFAISEPVFIVPLMLCLIVNWFLAMLMDKKRDRHVLQKTLLVLGITCDLGTLISFKYVNFVIEIVNTVAGKAVFPPSTSAIPIGISIVTLLMISYLVDVYRGEVVEKNPIAMGNYVLFFPRIVAGPINSYHSFMEQYNTRTVTLEKIQYGGFRLLCGVCKKVLIVNNMAAIADVVWGLVASNTNPKAVPALLAFVGMIATVLELYYYFSAYADMAIGIASILGFQLEENVKHPFVSKSLSDFVRRFNVSLDDWMSEYVEEPLHKHAKKNHDKIFRNYLITGVLIGLWYGNSMRFIWLGLFIAVCIGIERYLYLDRSDEKEKVSVLRHIYVIATIILFFMILKSYDMNSFMHYAASLFGLNANGFYSPQAIAILREYGIVFLVGIAFLFPIKIKIKRGKDVQKGMGSVLLAILLIAGLSGSIYYREDIAECFQKQNNESSLSIAQTITTVREDIEAVFLESDEWSALEGSVGRVLQQKELDSFAIVKDKDGFLYSGSFWNTSDIEAKEMALRVRRLQDKVTPKGTKVVFLVFPSKYNKAWTNGYEGMPYADMNTFADKVEVYFRRYNVDYLDYRTLMESRNETIDELFYKTEQYWTIPAAFNGFCDLTEYLNTEYDANLDLENYYRDLNNYTVEQYDNVFIGSQGRKAGKGFASPENYTFILPKFETEYTYEFEEEDGEKEDLEGDILDTLIDKSYLEEENLYSRKLDNAYLHEVNVTDKIVNKKNENGLKVLFLRDGYASPLATFFSSYCSQIDMLWTSKNKAKDIEKAVMADQYDYVFIALSVDSFSKQGVPFCVKEQAKEEIQE